MKKFFLVFIVLFVCMITAVYVLRHEIFQLSSDVLIEKYLPEYLAVEKIEFNFEEGKLDITGLGIKNPQGYDNKFLAHMDKVTCYFKMKTKNILDGIEITKILASSPQINIERVQNGRLNINEMDKVLSAEVPSTQVLKKSSDTSKDPGIRKKKGMKLKLSDFLKITDTINIKNGKINFTDKKIARRPYFLQFGEINGTLVIDLDDTFTKVLSVNSKGSGILNNDISQNIDWVVSLDPIARKLTMSNRFEVSGLDLTLFKPYYEKFSPINIDSGRFSGTLVFDFDHGNIGSMNTLILQGLRFSQKEEKDRGGIGGWQKEIIPELIKYLKASSGNIAFDFSIKGTMQNPRFYPGPKVKKALQSLVVNKIADAFKGLSGDGSQTGTGEGSSDMEKAISLISGILQG